ncbi:MAG: TatD family hydrolase [Fusobacteriaceae bacterium]|nr:TatD family hydrolase [Fusobacteriaceae bacterium]MBP6322353.1 TatD family hydrolase [Fusobacteriaceae bacterium]MBP9509537.1 TatD family hydrolase [Fusobacteriaceae bacterium]
MKLVDTHCHLNHKDFNDDREDIFKEIEENMEFVVNIGYDLSSSRKSIEYAEKYKNVYATVGLHPTDIGDEWNPIVENALLEMGKNEKVVAIGEIGLDYHWMTKNESVQKQWFREQMEIARKLNKPVVIHTREATEDTVKILKEFPDLHGIVHCYPGSYEIAMEVIGNYYFGIGGVLTFKNSKKMVEVVKKLPLERLVIETDAPYLTPEPFRGKRNLPEYVKYVVEKIAEIKGVSVEEVAKITNQNAKEVYKIS